MNNNMGQLFIQPTLGIAVGIKNTILKYIYNLFLTCKFIDKRNEKKLKTVTKTKTGFIILFFEHISNSYACYN